MDPPPPPQPPPPAAATSAAVSSTPTPTTNSNPPNLSASNTSAAAAATYPDSTDSSPRSRTTDSYFNDPPLLPSKLRLMCSYGGHIVPRPHDKSLCYVGGDTRIVVVDRHTSLSSLSSRLANTLLNGRAFTLKYQLPSEDLDSLISVTTDEDLENMIDEYDRTNSNAANSGKPSRLRLFLFPLKPDSSQSIGPILESNAKSEDWFLNALNGATGLLNRGFSDSASVNCLLGLDDDSLNGNNNLDLVGGGGGGGVRDVEALQKIAKQGQDVHSVPDSPMLETTSSFGSTSSSPSLANLPPIRVHVEDGSAGGVRGVLQDQKVVGIEEQFAQVTVSGGGGGVVGHKQDDGFMAISSPPPMPVSLAISGVPVGSPMVVGDYHNRVFSDDERSDHGVPLGYRKPPPPQSQPQTMVPQTQQKSSSGGEAQLPSPDSVSSDNSLSSAINRQKPMIYQDQIMQIPAGVSRVASSSPVDPKMNFTDPNHRVQIQQQVQDSGYVLQPQFEQQQQQQPQQFIHAGTHYIQHHPSGAVPMPAYYSVYPPPQQQHHIQHHHQLDQQYPVYYVQTRQQPQPYNLPMQQQSSINESTPTVPSTPQTQQNPTMAPPQATYNPMRNAPMPKPEMANSGMYRTATSGTPQLVQVSSNQHQQQYVGYSQVHHPSQSGSPVSGVPANYAYEFADPAHAQIYYTQPIAPTIPSHYQTMTAGGAVVLPESSQLPNESIKQQQNRTSQPI